MGYYALCGKCGNEIGHTEYRGKIDECNYSFCYNCMYEIVEHLTKWLNRQTLKEKKNDI